MAQTPPCPLIDKTLIDHLAAVFPGKIQEVELSAWAYGALAGEQRVINRLRAALREQEKANVR